CINFNDAVTFYTRNLTSTLPTAKIFQGKQYRHQAVSNEFLFCSGTHTAQYIKNRIGRQISSSVNCLILSGKKKLSTADIVQRPPHLRCPQSICIRFNNRSGRCLSSIKLAINSLPVLLNC